MKVEWLPLARQDREWQLSYLGERDPWAAINVGDAIEMAVNHLPDHPRIGRVGRVRGTRELVVAGTPYILAYRIEQEAVVILRLLHSAQKWPGRF
ncbi:MAG TPA: type II toxin-antitoxin system RelE/ParE family toxin [Acetobacteraceae bacterium]|nr:type II toxin-antitoxin system RelE/ParE family toxin [Acetobacteraceae bacterium]